jgi:hypothetical protein
MTASAYNGTSGSDDPSADWNAAGW